MFSCVLSGLELLRRDVTEGRKNGVVNGDGVVKEGATNLLDHINFIWWQEL